MNFRVTLAAVFSIGLSVGIVQMVLASDHHASGTDGTESEHHHH